MKPLTKAARTHPLITAIDAELNVAVAEHVAGWVWRDAGGSGLLYLRDPSANQEGWLKPKDRDTGNRAVCQHVLDYVNDPAAVLALLEKQDNAQIYWNPHNQGGWAVCICQRDPNRADFSGRADTFCRAACIALLRSCGVEVTEGKKL